MTTNTSATSVPVPASAEADPWDRDYRTLTTVRSLDGYSLKVWSAATQFADGSIDIDGISEVPNIYIECGEVTGMTSAQARHWSG